MKIIPPTVKATGFNCPHCGVLTTQFWHNTVAIKTEKNQLPFIPTHEMLEKYQQKEMDDEGKRREILIRLTALLGGGLFFEQQTSALYGSQIFHNLFCSQCFDCKKIAVWVHDKLIYPSSKSGPPVNLDLPDDIAADYEEARSILDLSPRGAAALLRLCIQKICIHLGEKGKKIDDDIASLAAKGLNPIVKKSLDIVRVVGNDAVHPGTMDLRDDRDTALQLFSLVNIISQQMISLPKSVEELYLKIPESKRDAIDARDAKALKNSQS